jgi:Zn-dependent protease
MSDQAAGSMRLFTIFGIHVFVHWSWFVAAYFLYQFSDLGLPVFLSVYLTLFGIVLLHEFGHALACRSVGGVANRIVLWPLGGIAFVRPPHRPWPMLWSIAAGPLVNVILLPVTVVLYLVMVGKTPSADLTPLQIYISLVMQINIALLLFNLLPVYPLDGGQIVLSILWFFMGYAKSLRVSATVGLVMAVVAGGIAAYLKDWWGVAIVCFIGLQAWNGLRYARLLSQAEMQQRRSLEEMLPPQ